ncbi:unnamed protein product [Protopolystoma xenopodis]|uniref:Uncharacterized protein n=1 Tax=Protopolystoma xenopodis TaxID=117903 RepID=A0A3S5FEU2_9PLAT|nr:unnamed protein product [Protopolystoma xenopodis]
MLPRSDDVRHATDESLSPFHRNRSRLPRKQRQHESSKKNPPSSSGGADLPISSPHTFTRNGTAAMAEGQHNKASSTLDLDLGSTHEHVFLGYSLRSKCIRTQPDTPPSPTSLGIHSLSTLLLPTHQSCGRTNRGGTSEHNTTVLISTAGPEPWRQQPLEALLTGSSMRGLETVFSESDPGLSRKSMAK